MDLPNVTENDEAKLVYIATEVQRNFDFRMESKKILAGEATATLNWLFALAITPAGYVFTKASEISWWIAVPCVLCSLASAITAVYLFENALKMEKVLPSGNEPKNLATQNVLALSLQEIRVAEICNLQERIELATAHNHRAGTAINKARWAIALITGGSVILLAILYCWANGVLGC